MIVFDVLLKFISIYIISKRYHSDSTSTTKFTSVEVNRN